MILIKETTLEITLLGNALSNHLLISYDNAQPSSTTTTAFGTQDNKQSTGFYFR